MPAAETQLHEETEADRIERWRIEELMRAGYDSSASVLLAARMDIDLHLAVELIHQGCPPATALRILL